MQSTNTSKRKNVGGTISGSEAKKSKKEDSSDDESSGDEEEEDSDEEEALTLFRKMEADLRETEAKLAVALYKVSNLAV